MSGSERPRTVSAWLETVRGRMRFAGFAYLASSAMLLTLVAGAFITSQGGSTEQVAPVIAEASPAASTEPSAGDGDAMAELATTVQDLAPPTEEAAQATPTPAPQDAAPSTWVYRRRFAAAPPPVADAGKSQAASTPSVQITDNGFVPDQITVKAGDAIQWTNDGAKVHTATSLPGAPRFDTGGLATHQSAKVAFTAPGTFTYSSATDCLNGNHDPGFTCGKYFAVTVTS